MTNELKPEIEEINIDPLLDGEMPEHEEREITPQNFKHFNYVKIDGVGNPLNLTVLRVVRSGRVQGQKKDSGETFTMGLKRKDGTKFRIDLDCVEGRFTINSWEIYFKLLGRDGLLTKYGQRDKTFAGAMIQLTRNCRGKYKTLSVEDISKIEGISLEEAQSMKDIVVDAIKNNKLYEVSLINN